MRGSCSHVKQWKDGLSLRANNMKHIYQPLDLAGNINCKRFLCQESQNRFLQIEQQINSGYEPEHAKVVFENQYFEANKGQMVDIIF